MKRTIRVEVWADVQCVWCYVGDARWKRALVEFEGQVQVVHRSYELQPGFPVDVDTAEYLRTQRGMSAQEQQRVFDGMREVVAEEGLDYAPEAVRATNSHLALELLHHAEAEGRRTAMSDRLYRAYFAEGRHLGTVDALVALAEEAGLDGARARVALEAGTFADAVDQDAAAAQALGVRGVPFVLVDDRYVIAGAQGTEQIVSLLQQVAAA